jgi:hypothetical protein
MSEQDISTESVAATCRVFISYSHDSKQHKERVHALADQLRTDGIESWIDQYVQDPNEGWIRWMSSQVKQANRVLLVFTETYLRRFEGDEEEGIGLGGTFEGVIVTQALYESGGKNAKFRPIVFREEDERFIPSELRRFNRYRIDTRENYKTLLRWLHDAPEIVAPPVRPKPDLTTKPAPELFPSKLDGPRGPTVSPSPEHERGEEGSAQVQSERDVEGFYTEVGVKRLIDETSGSGERSEGAVLIYKTQKQHTWLVATYLKLYCIVDDFNRRKSRDLIQWSMLLHEANPIKITDSGKPNSGFLNIGRRKDWYYSKRLFPTDGALVQAIKRLILAGKSARQEDKMPLP